jgi:hypothetical protein
MPKDYETDLAKALNTQKDIKESVSLEELEDRLRAIFYGEDEKEKESSILPIDSVDLADEWGRELARDLEKTAIGFPVGFGSRMSAGAIGSMRRTAGGAVNALNSSSMGRAMGMGSAAGGLMGAMRDPGYDPQTGMQKSRLGNIAMGAATGAAAGYGAKSLAAGASTMKGNIGNHLRKGMAATNKATPVVEAVGPKTVGEHYNSGASGYKPAQDMKMNRIQQGYSSLGNQQRPAPLSLFSRMNNRIQGAAMTVGRTMGPIVG